MLVPSELETIDALHREAMELVEQAHIENFRGNPLGAQVVFQTALLKEREAAELLREVRDYEPTRSVLFLGAASLASKCGDDPEARRLAREGLRGSPSREVERDLKDLATDDAGEETHVRGEQDRFYSRLAAIPGVHPLPSIGNWILLQVQNPAELARRVNRRLNPEAMSVPRQVSGTVRIHVSDRQTNERILDAIREAVA